MRMTADEACSLRVRWRGDEDVQRHTAPFVQSGRLVALVADEAGEGVTMRVGPTSLTFFIADFAEPLGGLGHARRLLRDAVEHQDLVEIRVLRDRLSYRNEAQYRRVQGA